MTGWDAWQSAWAEGEGPLPDVRSRAEREARHHRRSRVSVAVLLVVAALGAIPAFQAPEGLVHLIGWMILAFCAASGIGFLVIHRGVGLAQLATPREALSFIERRLGAEMRAAHLTRWVYLGMFLVFGVLTQLLYIEHGSPLPVRFMTLGCCLLGLAFAFAAPIWVGRIARRRQSEIDRWRGWLEEQNL
jgi:hypothetical protein